jgi:Ni/Fe-hydrogenase subunit HybB-like protein
VDKIAVQRLRDLLWFLVMAGLVAASVRFTRGLGATTGLNDAAPWGLWIAVKLGFVALAGGGFTLAGLVYVFRLESLRPMLRRAILIALLGYASFIVSLLFDLGLPWHIYMPILNWQHHSVMFEIAWCVMLYFSVLGLEFMPVILEHPWFARPFFKNIYHLLHRATIPLVIAGIVLSTLHQSSLGALFLIMPHRVHPLWYSAWIPVLFFTQMMGIAFGFAPQELGFGREIVSAKAALDKIGQEEEPKERKPKRRDKQALPMPSART